jgi:uncharacterized damage-inducible protein DinB
MDKDTLALVLEFSRSRLLGILEAIEKSGLDVNKVLAWRPGPGRAHVAWQAMHCAATHDRYLNVSLLKGTPKEAQLVANFAGGTIPSDDNVPPLGVIRDKLASQYDALKNFVAQQTPQTLETKVAGPGGKDRTVGESIILLAWHEAHHQGQIHLTWNLYKANH